MKDEFCGLLDPSGFVPRAVCGQWTSWEVLLNNVSDLMIALAYVLIPLILVYFARRRKDLPFSWLFLVFGAFIITCGSTHVLEIVLFYYPIYHLAGWLKALTALASWGAVFALIHIAPKAMSLRSPLELEKLNLALAAEVQERQRAEENLDQKNRKLQQAERLKDEFLANVSHELRTPLTLVLSPVESLLEEQGQLSKMQKRQLLELIQANSTRLLQQVNHLLDFSRYNAGRLEVHREPTDVDPFISRLLDNFRPVAGSQSVELHYQGQGQRVCLLDRYLLERIFFNLVSNALKHTPAGGHIHVRLEWVDSRLSLSVQDSGPGVDPADLPYLFERFRQGSRQTCQGGTGLGLALVREFASVLGGGAEVVNTPGQGACFVVTVLAPLSQLAETQRATLAPLSPHAPVLVSEAPTQSHLPRLLLAEDDPELASYISVVLSGVAQVKWVRDGQTALLELDEWQPQLLLSDVMMPQLSGFELCRRVKSHSAWANLPVVLITALTHREALLEGWEAGADEFLFKPFHPTELVTRVRSLLANSQLRLQLEANLRQSNQLLEEQIHAQNQQLSEALQAAKAGNDAKTRFLGNLSHDLRTPLAAVVGMAELALTEVQSASLEKKIQTIRSSALGLNGLLDDLIDFSRLEAGKLALRMDSIDLVRFATEVHQSLGAQAQARGLGWHLKVGLSSAVVRVDESRLRHILINLLANAIKFTDSGQIELGLGRSADGVYEFWVQDTGIGIDQADQVRILQPFEQVDSSLRKSRQGAGLGLAICTELLALMGSALTIESEVGKGSCFRFRLQLPASEIQATEPSPPSQKTWKILVVEDHPLIRSVMRLLLEGAGHQVWCEETGFQALETFRSQAPEVVFLDLQLPDMDGFQTAAALRQINPAVPLIAVTAHAGEEYRTQCLQSGFQYFLTKPVEGQALFQVLRNLEAPPV